MRRTVCTTSRGFILRWFSLLESGLFGSFTALNFFHWFLFWELSLIPAFFLIKLWGGARRGPAATQFFVYTMAGSRGAVVAFLAVFLSTGSMDFARLTFLASTGELEQMVTAHLGPVMMWLAIGVLAGFAVKVPMIPFHTWLPAAYAEAPSPVTMLLTGAMSKMGVYGLLRIALPLFGPQIAQIRTPLLVLAVATVVMGAWAAAAQKDLKRVFAYSSVNHLGYCLLGIFALAVPAIGVGAQASQAAALNGVILQMFNHGVTAAALFWFVAMLQQRTGGHRGIDDFGGLRKPAPVLAGLMGIALFSSLGLPGLNGFVGEFLIFRGVFPLAWVAATVSVLGLLVTAAVILTVIQKVFNGPVPEHCAGFPDLHDGERLALAPVIGLMLLVGLLPQLIVGQREPNGLNLLGALEILIVGVDDLSLVCRSTARGVAAQGQPALARWLALAVAWPGWCWRCWGLWRAWGQGARDYCRCALGAVDGHSLPAGGRRHQPRAGSADRTGRCGRRPVQLEHRAANQ